MQGLRFARRAGWALVGVVCLVMALLAFPQPLFAFEHKSGTITFRADAPIDVAGANAVAHEIRARLDRSPLPIGSHQFTLYVANEPWRRRIVFSVYPDAGGVVYAALASRHAFLSGADFPRGLLRAPGGRVLPPPRTLAYYGAHEISHLLTADRTGLFRFYTMPEWVREGLADYSALGPVRDVAALSRDIGGRTLGVEDWDAHGYYIRYRILVTHFLDAKGWTLDRLLATDLSEDAAWAAMERDLAGAAKVTHYDTGAAGFGGGAAGPPPASSTPRAANLAMIASKMIW